MPEYLETACLELTCSPHLSGNELSLARKLRGAIAQSDCHDLLLHQHAGKQHVYIYPRVQYRVYKGKAIILGVEEGVSTLEHLADILPDSELKLGSKSFRVQHTNLTYTEKPFGSTPMPIQYKFLTPWLPLNSSNYNKYKTAIKEKKIEILSSILIGNILSMSKSLGYSVDELVNVNRLLVQEASAPLKDVQMLAFEGTFSVNFQIPDWFGLGKSPARNFGVVENLDGKQGT